MSKSYISAIATKALWWFENNGAAIPVFLPQIIASNVHLFGLHTADLDYDGDIDIVATHSLTEKQVLWFENDGGVNPVFTF